MTGLKWQATETVPIATQSPQEVKSIKFDLSMIKWRTKIAICKQEVTISLRTSSTLDSNLNTIVTTTLSGSEIKKHSFILTQADQSKYKHGRRKNDKPQSPAERTKLACLGVKIRIPCLHKYKNQQLKDNQKNSEAQNHAECGV